MRTNPHFLNIFMHNSLRKLFLLVIATTFCFSLNANSVQNSYQITVSILSYVKWPVSTPKLCVLDDGNAYTQLKSQLRHSNLPMETKLLTSNQIKNTICHAVFFSQSTPEFEQHIINQSANKQVITFSTSNVECEIGSTFCLMYSKSGNAIFKVNLDSLTRSKAHVDPRVLLLARNQE